jgi:membrane-associated phospholipid phosphatase
MEADDHSPGSPLVGLKALCKRQGGEIALAASFFVLGRLISSFSTVHQQYLPAYHPQFDYPIQLNGVWCTRTDINLCSEAGNTTSMATSCCQNIDARPGNTVTTASLALVSIIIPATFFVVGAILDGIGTIKHRLQPINNMNLLVFSETIPLAPYLLSCGANTMLTHWIKTFVGRPRPNFYAYTAYGEYHQNEHAMREAHSSFPSGHASTSFAALLFTSLWLLDVVKRRLRARSVAHEKTSCPPLQLIDSLAVYACFTPTIVAIYISITRVVDYWHNTDDILTGAPSPNPFRILHCLAYVCASCSLSPPLHRHRYHPAHFTTALLSCSHMLLTPPPRCSHGLDVCYDCVLRGAPARPAQCPVRTIGAGRLPPPGPHGSAE